MLFEQCASPSAQPLSAQLARALAARRALVASSTLSSVLHARSPGVVRASVGSVHSASHGVVVVSSINMSGYVPLAGGTAGAVGNGHSNGVSISVAHDETSTSTSAYAYNPDVPLLPVNGSQDGSASPPPTGLTDKYGKPLLLHQASLLACTAAMTNTILGAGMLGVPHAIAESGFLLGVALLLMAGCASAFALHLLAVSAQTTGVEPASFFAVASRAVPRATFLIDIAVAIKCFGVQTGFLVVIGDLVPAAIHTLAGPGHPGFVYDRRFWILLYIAAFVMPLSCLRSLNALRFTATISIGFVSFLVGVIFLYAVVPSLDACAGMVLDECRGPTALARAEKGTLKVLSIFVFAFTCHQNIFTACNELSSFTVPRINKVIGGAIGTTGALYLVIGVFAYKTFGSRIVSDVLNNYPDNTVLAIARLLIATNCAFTFPMQCNPCRASISLLMHQWHHRHTERSLAKPLPVHVPGETRLSILTALLVLGSLGIAMVVHDLGLILAVVGATGSTTISYILPGIIFLKVHPVWTTKHYFAAALLATGCVIIPSCLTFIFI